jgi:hypothetical protein
MDKDLVALALLPGSMASAENAHEGMAEWVRRKVVDPASVERLPVDKRIMEAMQREMPAVLGSILDAGRAYHTFMQLPASVRWAKFNQRQKENAGLKEMMHAVTRFGEQALDGVSSGAPVARLDRRLARMIVRERADAGLTYGQAVAKMREARLKTGELVEAHNMILQIGPEVQMAWSGKGPGRGVRLVNMEGKLEVIHPRTWEEIIKDVKGAQYEQFEQAGWAKEALRRYEMERSVDRGEGRMREQAMLEFPGYMEGVRPEDLRQIVAQAKRDIPDFDRKFDEVQTYFDALLEMEVRAGLKSREEQRRIQKEDSYWPLPRVIEREGRRSVGISQAEIRSGLRRAFGSGEAIRPSGEIDEVPISLNSSFGRYFN